MYTVFSGNSRKHNNPDFLSSAVTVKNDKSTGCVGDIYI